MYAHLQEPPPSVTAERPELPREIDARRRDGRWPRRRTDRQASRRRARRRGRTRARRRSSRGADGSREPIAPPAARPRPRGRGRARRRDRARRPLFRDDAGAAARGRSTSPPAIARAPPRAPAFRTVDRALVPDEERLLASIPEDVSRRLPAARPASTDPGRARGARRVRPTDVEVLYELFPTRDAMDAAFQVNVNNAGGPGGGLRHRPPRRRRRIRSAAHAAGRVLCYTVERGTFSAPRQVSRTSRTSSGPTRTPRSTRTRSGTISATSACTSGGCRRRGRSSLPSERAGCR